MAKDAAARMLPAAKRAEFRICTAWPEAVGPEIAARTWPVRASGGTLVVATAQAAWANELGYVGEDLRERLNAALGEEAVSRVRFVVRPEPRQGGEAE